MGQTNLTNTQPIHITGILFFYGYVQQLTTYTSSRHTAIVPFIWIYGGLLAQTLNLIRCIFPQQPLGNFVYFLAMNKVHTVSLPELFFF